MKPSLETAPENPAYSGLNSAQLRQLLLQKEAEFADILKQRENYILLLEEMLRLAKIQRFAAKSEKHPLQIDLFDEAELEAAIDELADQLPDDEPAKPRSRKRQRGSGWSLISVRKKKPVPSAPFSPK